MRDKYLNPFTDFGFKKLFGEEPNKDLLISFLNTLLPQRHQIQDLEYTRNEHLGPSEVDRKAIFDLHCKNSAGEYFIVELQKAKQRFFKDRSVYYSTFPIQAQAEQGVWDYRLQAVYTIGILDFLFDEQDGTDVVHHVQLKNQHNQVFYDKLTFIYLTLPNFTKSSDELTSLQDKWFYIFRHLQELQSIPPALQEKVFTKLFRLAELGKMSPDERMAYESSLKYYRDLNNVTDSARIEGWEEGREAGLSEGRVAEQRLLVGKLHLKGMDAGAIAGLLDIPEAVVREWLGGL